MDLLSSPTSMCKYNQTLYTFNIKYCCICQVLMYYSYYKGKLNVLGGALSPLLILSSSIRLPDMYACPECPQTPLHLNECIFKSTKNTSALSL